MGVNVTYNLDFTGGSLKLGDLNQPFSAYDNTFISYDLGNYSWNNCPHTWESFTKTWEMAGMMVVKVDVDTTLTVTDTATKNSGHIYKESIAVRDACAARLDKLLSEAVRTVDSFKSGKTFARIIVEAIHVTDLLKNIRGKLFAENIGIAESVPEKFLDKMVPESIALLEEYSREAAFHLLAAESIALAVKYTNFTKKPAFEKLKAADWIAKDLKLPKFEQVALAEAAGRIFYARPKFNEAIAVAEETIKEIAVLKQENFVLYDTIIQACRAVLSNIAITEGGMSLTEFEEATQTAPGYTPFMDFKVGEYEYKEALVRLVVEAVVEQTQPSVSGVIMHVDIPDTQDRGTAEIENTDTPTKVFFNKFFYNPPEVAVNLRGGNTGDGIVTPNIVSTDKKDENGNRYFEVELINTNGQRVTGLVTWQAVGY